MKIGKHQEKYLLHIFPDICPYILDYLNIRHGDIMDGSLYLLNFPINRRHDHKHIAMSNLVL